MKIATWNVDGYDLKTHQIILSLIYDEKIDILFLTEIKCEADKIIHIDGYIWLINSHLPSHYHGVAMLIKDDIKFEELPVDLNIHPRYDTRSPSAATGRVITIKIKDVYIVGVYSPNSGVNGLKNIGYRTNVWDQGLADYLNSLGEHVLLIGDLNIAFSPKDVSDPVSMKHWAGYTIQERRSFKEKMANFHDVYREFNPDGQIYTWIGNNPRVNYGMRLDHIMTNSSEILRKIKMVLFYQFVMVSDHIPVGCIISL